MRLAQTLNPCFAVNDVNFEKRFGRLLKTRSLSEMNRFATVLKQLDQMKARLVAEFSRNPLIAYRVRGGLGAICITCAEDYVTPILVDNGFGTQIVARETPIPLCEGTHRLPAIHAYNIVTVGGVDFIVDMDADPFVGQNSGIVVAPLRCDSPFGWRGFPYHYRRVDRTGRITSYKFLFEDKWGRSHSYLEGDTAEYMTIAPYHNPSSHNLCPLCFAGGATLYFGFETYYIGTSGPYRRIYFTLVCPVSPADKDRVYQVTIDDVAEVRVRGHGAVVGGHSPDGCITIAVTLTDGHRVQLLLASDGTLAANDFVRFVPTETISRSGSRVRVGTMDGPRPRVALPRPASP